MNGDKQGKRHDGDGRNMPAVLSRLLPEHLAELNASAISGDFATTVAKCYTITDPAEAARLLNWNRPAVGMVPALAFPYLEPDGTTRAVQLKFSKPRKNGKTGKPVKYEWPKGIPNKAYILPAIRELLSDPKISIAITEGVKKVLSLISAGVPAIGLIGVWSWHIKRPTDAAGKSYGERELIDCLEQIVWDGRVVFIIFDSDIATNVLVASAEKQLAITLASRGAIVKAVRIPPAADGSKQGADDYIAAQGVDAFRKLVDSATVVTELFRPVYELDDPGVLARRWLKIINGNHNTPIIRFWRSEFWEWKN